MVETHAHTLLIGIELGELMDDELIIQLRQTDISVTPIILGVIGLVAIKNQRVEVDLICII